MTSLPIRDELRELHPYGAPQLDVPVRLNTNENPFSPPREFVEALGAAVVEAAKNLNRYPDREAMALRSGLAAYLNAEAEVDFLAADRIWVGNGSNEVMTHVMQAFAGPGRKALTFAPTYSMYEEYARNSFTEFVTVPRRADHSIDVDVAVNTVRLLAPSVVFIASPNNPTGTAQDLGAIETLLRQTEAMIVVDEAYAEFRRPGVPSAVTLLPKYERLIVTRTMSKAFGFAGARVGYLAAHPEVVDALRIVRLPYHLSAITQAVALTALEHTSMLAEQVQVLRAERDALVDWFDANGFEACHSDANFVLFGRFADRHAVWQALVDEGVLVREVGPAEFLRVSIGTPNEMVAFQNALLKVSTS